MTDIQPLALFFKGLVIGLSIAAPVGPIGLLCIRRTLSDGRLAGLVTGLGAASADAVYGALAALGLTAITTWLVSSRSWLGAVGGAVLIIIGIRAFMARPPEQGTEPDRASLAGMWVATFGLTLTNPMTILSFAAVFAGLGLGAVGGTGRQAAPAAMMIGGVFSGSALWWLLLTTGVSLFRSRISHRGMAWINRLAGVVIIAFGVVIVVGL